MDNGKLRAIAITLQAVLAYGYGRQAATILVGTIAGADCTTHGVKCSALWWEGDYDILVSERTITARYKLAIIVSCLYNRSKQGKASAVLK